MSSNLGAMLVAVRPADRSGSIAQNRFDFQADWALCHLLELHAAGHDYAIVFDYHDDVLVLDSGTEPKAVSFYQIKTAEKGEWNKTKLIRGEARARSILAKLYQHYVNFGEHTQALTFVSNAGFSFRRDGEKKCSSCDSFVHGDMHAADRSEVEAKIAEQLGVTPPLVGTTLVQFLRCKLSHTSHTDSALARLGEFLENLDHGDNISLGNSQAFFRSLKSEILRGSREEFTPQNFEELCRLKAISRSAFEAMLRKVRSTVPVSDWAEIIRSRLNSEGANFLYTQRVSSNVTRVIADRFNARHTMLKDALNDITASLDLDGLMSMKLEEAICQTYDVVIKRHAVSDLLNASNRYYIYAAIGLLLHEQSELPALAADSQDPDQ